MRQKDIGFVISRLLGKINNIYIDEFAKMMLGQIVLVSRYLTKPFQK